MRSFVLLRYPQKGKVSVPGTQPERTLFRFSSKVVPYQYVGCLIQRFRFDTREGSCLQSGSYCRPYLDRLPSLELGSVLKELLQQDKTVGVLTLLSYMGIR